MGTLGTSRIETGLRFVTLVLLSGIVSACNKVDFQTIPQSPDQNGAQVCTNPKDPSTCSPGDGDNGGNNNNNNVTNEEENVTAAQATTKIDILFVVDSSGSMAKERTNLGSRLSAFIGQLNHLDWHICVTTTDVETIRGRPLTFKNGATFLDKNTANANSLFLDRMNSIAQGSGDEQAIAALNMAFDPPDSNCYRSDAALAAIILSDEDERSTGGFPEFAGSNQYRDLGPMNFPASAVSTVARVWGQQKTFTAHSIVIKPGDQACWDQQAADSPVWFGRRYQALSKLTGGIVGNICATDYSSQLVDFATQIQNSLSSITLKCEPVSSPTVTITPMASGQTYKSQGNKILFSPALTSGTHVNVRYQCPK